MVKIKGEPGRAISAKRKITMKNVILILFIFLSGAGFAQQKKQPAKKPPLKYWEELTEKEKSSTLADSSLPKNIADLYNGKFYFTDKKENAALLNSLVSPSGSIVALRLYLLHKLVESSDTSIAALLKEYAVKMAYAQPDMLLRFFAKEHAKKNNVYKKYISLFADDLDERVEYQNFKDFMDLYFNSANAETRQMLALIYKECEKAGAGNKNPVPVPLPPKERND